MSLLTKLAGPLAAAFGVTFSVPDLALAPVTNDGLFGITSSSKAVARGDKLLSVPISSCLAVPRGPDDDVLLASALLRAVVSESAWGEYRESFLPDTTGAAFTWEADEMGRLQLEAVCESATSLRQRCEDAFGNEDEPLDDNLLAMGFDAWCWAFSIVYSRSFTIDADGSSPQRVLAPFVDLFNHQPESPAEYAAACELWEADGLDEPPSPWRVDTSPADAESKGPYLSLHADHDAAAGAELRVPYGIETSAELLATSGFLPMQGNSADYIALFADVVELVGTLARKESLSDEQQQARLSILSAMDAVDAPLAVRPGGVAGSLHVVRCAMLVAAEDTELELFADEYDETIGHYTLHLPEMASAADMPPDRVAALEARALALCAEAADELLDELPTSLAEDEEAATALAAETPAADDDDAQVWQRGAMALRYRIGAKQLLTEFAEACRRRG